MLATARTDPRTTMPGEAAFLPSC